MSKREANRSGQNAAPHTGHNAEELTMAVDFILDALDRTDSRETAIDVALTNADDPANPPRSRTVMRLITHLGNTMDASYWRRDPKRRRFWDD